MTTIDVQKYLHRIGIKESTSVNLRFLKLIQQSHLYTIPFENLDIHYGTPIKLDVLRIYEKIISQRRGGFCYEINGLLHQLLIQIGFEAELIAARVFQKADQYSPLYDHLAILVQLEDQQYLVDAGFGKFTLLPLPIIFKENIIDPLGTFKMEEYKNEFIKVSSLKNDNWTPEYIFSTEPRELLEFAERCHFHQTNEQSHFTRKKMISQLTSTGRITLHEDKLVETFHGEQKTYVIDSNEQFNKLLYQYFRESFLPKHGTP